MKTFDVYPINNINITKGLGSYVWDDQGHKYLDMYGGHAVISIGHTNPYWVSAMEAQMNKISFYSNSIIIKMQEELADKLGKLSGKEDYQLFLINSGAEANENAMKLASFHTGRKKIIAFTNGFHGRTSLAVAVTDNPSIVAPVNETENAVILPFNDENVLSDYFKNHGDEIAAVIIEGIQGVGGIHVANDSFLKLIRTLCDKYGSVYIADSVQCGYGRTGMFYAHDHAGVIADIYTMAKGMGNGFPIGAISIAPHLKAKHGLLGTTFGGNHLACVAAIAVLDVIKKDHLIENAAIQGSAILSKLKSYSGLENVRGRGLMIGCDPNEANKSIRTKLLTEQRIFTGAAKPNVMRLLPSLALSSTEVDLFFEGLDVCHVGDM
jgi:acetylornithine/N-succinyldiaminopimelate aminotransferase